jgi:hypothetical protein
MSNLYQDDGPPATGQKVMLATTAYDSPDACYTFSIAQSREALSAAGIQSAYLLLSGNCHVDDARNSVVREFLASDCTELVFIDADVSWEPETLVQLCGHDLDIVGGVYPYRREDQRNKGKMPYRQLAGVSVKAGLLEVDGLPTGFLKIKRSVFVALSDSVNVIDKEGTLQFFHREIHDIQWSGDLNFCRKWREAGGSIYAAIELRLGHVAKAVLWDSLGASLRRSSQTTLSYVCDKIKAGTEKPHDIIEVVEYVGNHWGANEEVLLCAIAAARAADGPIIETGSGLTTILMAAATDHPVYCIEHDEHFANQTKAMFISSGVSNIFMVHCDIKDGWYDLQDKLPDRFALGLNDGPPRRLGDRMRFFDYFGDRCDMILSDDADEARYADHMTSWAETKGRKIAFPSTRAAIIMKEAA